MLCTLEFSVSLCVRVFDMNLRATQTTNFVFDVEDHQAFQQDFHIIAMVFIGKHKDCSYLHDFYDPFLFMHLHTEVGVLFSLFFSLLPFSHTLPMFGSYSDAVFYHQKVKSE